MCTDLCECKLSEYEIYLSGENALGVISFQPTSPSENAKFHFELGFKCLHSFMYDVAIEQFRKAQKCDSQMVIAYWGEAMSYRMALWNCEDQQAALNVLSSMDKHGDFTRCSILELGLVRCVKLLFAENVDQGERDENYLREIKLLHEEFQDDLDVSSLYALALMVVSSRIGGSQAQNMWEECAHVLENAYSNIPLATCHPGILHFLTHVFDIPDKEIAQRGLPAAKTYPGIGKAASHALHMPSHIYLRLGMWQESVRSNRQSIAASDKLAEMRGRGITFDFGNLYHSLEYLANDLGEVGKFNEADDCLSRMQWDSFQRQSISDGEIIRQNLLALQSEVRQCQCAGGDVAQEEVQVKMLPSASCHNKDGDAPVVPSHLMFEHYAWRMWARQVILCGKWEAAANSPFPKRMTDSANGEADFYLTECGALLASALGHLLHRLVEDKPSKPFSSKEWAEAKNTILDARNRKMEKSPTLIKAMTIVKICQRLLELENVCLDAGPGKMYSALATRCAREQIHGLVSFILDDPEQDWQKLMQQACKTQDEMANHFLPTSPTLLFLNSHQLLGDMLIVHALANEENSLDVALKAVEHYEKTLLALPNRSSCILGIARAYRICTAVTKDTVHTKAMLQNYTRLLDQWRDGDDDIPALNEAKRAIKGMHLVKKMQPNYNREGQSMGNTSKPVKIM
mmetsp:Transcript_11193/g.20809  ORF Transcript_11193/g.20809 Transcript_11193/m.20809 type:complete len:686 (-) Transcript_11193:94-2151(-)